MWIHIPIPVSPRLPLAFSSQSTLAYSRPASQPSHPPEPPTGSHLHEPSSPSTSSILDSPTSTIFSLDHRCPPDAYDHPEPHTHNQTYVKQPAKPTLGALGAVSGTESDSDSILTPEASSAHPTLASGGFQLGLGLAAGGSSQPPLSSIAERRSGSARRGDDENEGEGETEDEEEEEENPAGGGWRTPDRRTAGVSRGGEGEERILKTGYLWKKGERRKTWKKRWFVLRPAHLAYYKTSAEYQLLRLLDLSDIHSCVPVTLKRHAHTFGLVTVNATGKKEKDRTYLFEATDARERDEWVEAIEEARRGLGESSTAGSVQESAGLGMGLGTPAGVAAPIPIVRSTSDQRAAHAVQTQQQQQQGAKPASLGRAGLAGLSLSSSPGQMNVITSSDSEDGGVGAGVGGGQFVAPYAQQQAGGAPSPTAVSFAFPPPMKTPAGAGGTSASGYVSSGYVSSGERGASTSGAAPGKAVLSGYLMKCGKQRRTWRKRWFVLTEEKLVYSGSHMDTKPHRVFPFSEILDALEYELPTHSSKHKADHHHHSHPHIPSSIASNLPSSLTSKAPHREHASGSSKQHQQVQQSGGSSSAKAAPSALSPSTPLTPAPAGGVGAPSELMPSADDGGGGTSHTFKIVTTKRNLLLCAPSEDDEIKWLGAIRAIIARRSGTGVVPGGSGLIKGAGVGGGSASAGRGAVAGAVGVVGGVSGVVGGGVPPGSVVPVDVTLSMGTSPPGVGAGRKQRRMSHGSDVVSGV